MSVNTESTVIDSKNALITFYDIESLDNVFTLCAYTPMPGSADGSKDQLDVFYLIDSADLFIPDFVDRVSERILTSNPALGARSFNPKNIAFHNLLTKKAVADLAFMFGCCTDSKVFDRSDNPKQDPNPFWPVCDTDADFNPTPNLTSASILEQRHPYLAGFNSFNYDTTMLAQFFAECGFDGSTFTTLTTADLMRGFNNKLFANRDSMTSVLKNDARRIRFAMLNSGRHFDVARLNETQRYTPLKRLLGMLGLQILESDKLSNDSTLATTDQLLDLIAYNVSDCVGLAGLFAHPVYSGGFDLKLGLLNQYPQTRYSDFHDSNPTKVAYDRLRIDSSSAQFVAKILSPEGALSDIKTVSFDYPHPDLCADGQKPVNVLTEAKAFFESKVAPDRDSNPDQMAAYESFMNVYNFYKDIEGKNFNSSEKYQDDFSYGNPNYLPVISSLQSIVAKHKDNLSIPYFKADGTPAGTYVTFSTGGIHGAQYNQDLYNSDIADWLKNHLTLILAKYLWPDANEFVEKAKFCADSLTCKDTTGKDVVLHRSKVLTGTTAKSAKWRKPRAKDEDQIAQLNLAKSIFDSPADCLAAFPDPLVMPLTLSDEDFHNSGIDPSITGNPVDFDGRALLATRTKGKARWKDDPTKPLLFDKGRLNPKYVYTSAGLVIHEDFSSYYPNLLRNMKAFHNDQLGKDLYAEIFFSKEDLGAQLKTPGLDPDEKAHLSRLRNGTKLILNSASGAGDATFDTPILMNNRIISMRIIGQLFSWRIGQAQTLAGASIVSTNTDGLYSLLSDDFSADVNNQVLANESASIGVEIEPEPLKLVSKDSNNRLELDTHGHVINASGGMLACYAGPSPLKSLSHPAVVDTLLTQYLRTHINRFTPDFLYEPFDRQAIDWFLTQLMIELDRPKLLNLFAHVVAASDSSITYPFFTTDANLFTNSNADPSFMPNDFDQCVKVLAKTNRLFFVKPGTPGAGFIAAAAGPTISATAANKRNRDKLPDQIHNALADRILAEHGWDESNPIPANRDTAIRKVTNVDPAHPVVVVNDDLACLDPARVERLLGSLDLDVYADAVEQAYTRSWRNVDPDAS